MAFCLPGGCPALPSPARSIRVLRWTFRRDDEAVVCELGLNADDSAYELKVNSPANVTTHRESFDDVTAAFQRHASIEKLLVNEGWMLEAFDSEIVAR